MDNFGMWSNFAQIVWRDSRLVGCAMGSCGAYWVCHYGESITRTTSKQASKVARSLARTHAGKHTHACLLCILWHPHSHPFPPALHHFFPNLPFPLWLTSPSFLLFSLSLSFSLFLFSLSLSLIFICDRSCGQLGRGVRSKCAHAPQRGERHEACHVSQPHQRTRPRLPTRALWYGGGRRTRHAGGWWGGWGNSARGRRLRAYAGEPHRSSADDGRLDAAGSLNRATHFHATCACSPGTPPLPASFPSSFPSPFPASFPASFPPGECGAARIGQTQPAACDAPWHAADGVGPCRCKFGSAVGERNMQ